MTVVKHWEGSYCAMVRVSTALCDSLVLLLPTHRELVFYVRYKPLGALAQN